MNQYPNIPPVHDGGKLWAAQPLPPGPFSTTPKSTAFQQTTSVLNNNPTLSPSDALDFLIRNNANNSLDVNGQNGQSMANDLSTTTRQPFSKPGSMLSTWKNLQLPTMPTASVFYGGGSSTNSRSNNDHRNSSLLAEDIQRMIGAISGQLPMANETTTVNNNHQNIIPTFMNPLTVQHFSPKITSSVPDDSSNGKTNGHPNGQESGEETAKNLALLTEFCSKSANSEDDGVNDDGSKHNGNDLEVAKAMLSMREFSPRAVAGTNSEASSSMVVRCPSNNSAVSEPAKVDLMNGSVSSLLSSVHIQSISPDNKGIIQDNGNSISNLISTMSPYINPSIFLSKDQATSSFLIKSEQQQHDQNGGTLNQPTIYKCQICKFSSSSKFHFNSHMNTHTDHKCTYCDYTSRTIGRLKRHMNDFHTHDKKDEENNPPSGTEKPSTTTPSSSSSKPKTFRCKTCSVVVQSKDDLWTHQRSHIKSERILSCPKCTFVTEYKHHLEYHLRNHFGSKPFKCHKCNYTCVNKSMLNSHLKSHSNFYPYRCVNCRYTTKYCHSLKLHLQKYNHTSVTHLPDESPEGELEEARLEEAAGLEEGSPIEEASSTCAESMGMTATTSTFPTMMNELLFFKSNPINNNGNGFGLSPIVTSVLQQKFPTSAPFGAHLPTIATPAFDQHQCNICRSVFDSKEVLAAHMYKHIVESNEEAHTMAGHKINGNGRESSSPILRCKFCYQSDFDSKESLANHLVKHLVENVGLFGMYGLAGGRAGLMESLAAAAAVSSSLPPHHYRHHQDQFLAENSTSSRSRSVSNNTEEEMMMMASSTISAPMTGGGDGRQSPTSSSLNHNEEKNSASSETGGSEPGFAPGNGSTKRRKGKAFKLDQISQRLQRCSSASPDFMANEYTFSNGKRLETFDTSNDPSPSSTLKSDPTDLRRQLYRSDGDGNEDDDVDDDNDGYAMSAVIHRNNNAQTSFLTTTKEARNQIKAVTGNDAPLNETPTTSTSSSTAVATTPSFSDWSKAFVCKFCDMAFADSVMHAIHMGYHGYDDPFKCNMCGTITSDKLSMFLHVTQAPHL